MTKEEVLLEEALRRGEEIIRTLPGNGPNWERIQQFYAAYSAALKAPSDGCTSTRLREADVADLRIAMYPLHPPGGQHAGSPPTGIEIEHLPSGTRARCSAARSQHTNREIAMDMILTALTHPRFP